MKSTLIETARHERLENLFKAFVSADGSKQFRIVKVRTWPDGKGLDSYLSKRVIRYKTSFGDSSAGSEVAYEWFNEALEAEMRWLNEVITN